MLSLLKPKVAAATIPAQQIVPTYKRYRMQALLSVFLGYLAYYIVRNNFTLSTPYLKEQLDLSATQIGMLSSCMLIAYGISKGVMSSPADKASPKVFMACGLVMCAAVNVGLGFSNAFWIFVALVVINGLFRAWALAPRLSPSPTGFHAANVAGSAHSGTSRTTLAVVLSPHRRNRFCAARDRTLADRQLYRPRRGCGAVCRCGADSGKGSPRSEGLPALDEMLPEEKVLLNTGKVEKPGKHERMANLCTYVLKTRTPGTSRWSMCSSTWCASE